MEQDLGNLFAFSQAAVLGIENNHICYANASASAFFRRNPEGVNAHVVLPPDLLLDAGECSVRALMLFNTSCLVKTARVGKTTFLIISPQKEERQVQNMYDSRILQNLVNTLDTLRLSVDSLYQESKNNPAAQNKFNIFYHNYYNLLRQIENMRIVWDHSCGHLYFNAHEIDLRMLCINMVEDAGILLRSSRKIQLKCCEQPVCVKADQRLIMQLLLNLLTNAVYGTREQGEITVDLHTRNRLAILSVLDTGCGIPAQYMRNLFEARTSPEPEELLSQHGAGLGLRAARAIAEVHGGTLLIESVEKEGSHIRVTLPTVVNSDLAAGNEESLFMDSPVQMETLLTGLAPVLESSYYTEYFRDRE